MVSFSTTLTVPSVATGGYSIRADLPIGSPVEASTTFTVTATPSVILSPTAGRAGDTITIQVLALPERLGGPRSLMSTMTVSIIPVSRLCPRF